MVDFIFNLCVGALYWLSNLVGMTYEEVNVYIFVVAWPIVTLAMLGVIVGQRCALRAHRSR